jgi:hypothetical protein
MPSGAALGAFGALAEPAPLMASFIADRPVRSQSKQFKAIFRNAAK